MISRPIVTVITPVYNCAAFIEETMDSVLRQEYHPLHYFVLDDGSTDGTWQVINRYYSKNSEYQGRLEISRNSKNEGEQVTFNRLLNQIKGDYFMFVNADDPLLSGAVATLVGYMENHHEVLCAYPDWRSINENGSFRANITSREWDFAYMVRHHTCLPSVGSIFRREVIGLVGERDTSFGWVGDFDYWLRVALAGPMGSVPHTLATWRFRDGQLSRQKSDDRAREHVRVIDKFYSLPGVPTEIVKVKGEAKCWSYLVAAGLCNSKKLVVQYLLSALCSYPFIWLDYGFYGVLKRRLLHYLRR